MRFSEMDLDYSADDVQGRKKNLQEPADPGLHRMYRACPMDVTTFREMDYVTLSRKFAIEHAESMSWTEEEPYHVIKKMVNNTREPLLFNASNPGEYFYNGPEVAGKEIYVAKEWAEYQ